MSDTATQAPTTTTTVADSLNAVLKSAPELGNSPGLAVGVASSGGDTPARAQAVARGTNAIAAATAKNNVQSSVGSDISGALNWFGNSVAHAASDVIRPVEGAVAPVASDIAKTLNAPMQYVQHEYRYLHDVEARHGMLAGVLEGLGVAAGAAGGFALGGGYGAELGAEAATALEGQVAYRDSWARTANGATYTDPHTHMQVSFGRDIASALGLRRGTLAFNVGSGLIDGIADLQVGGNEVLGLVGKARSVEGASGLLGNLFPGISAATAEDFEQSYLKYGSVQRTMADIAGKSSGEILATPAYQSLMQISPRAATAASDVLTGNDFVKALGAAHTQDDVAEVFRDALRTHELVGMDSIPTLSFTRVPFQTLREAAENSTLGLSIARKFIRLPSAVDSSGAISMKVFDPTSATDNGAVGLYRMLMYTENRRTAASVVDTYINSNVAGKILIYRNAVMDVLGSMTKEFGGNLDDLNSNDMKAIKKALDNVTGGAEPGAEGWYGLDEDGRNISYVGDTGDGDRQYAMAITDNQTGKLRFIQLNEMRSMAHTIAGYRGLFGGAAKADDFLYNYVTQAVFKPLVLLTPSYAMHIALAELIPNALRLGVRNMVKSAIATNAARLGRATANEDEINAISGLAWRLVGLHRAETAASYLTAAPEDLSKMGQRIQLAARYIDAMGGASVDPALSSGHNLSAEVDQEYRNTVQLHTAIANTPMMRGNEYAKFGQDSDQFVSSWADWINADLVKDEKTRLAASTMRTSLAAGKSIDEASQDAVASVSTWLHAQPQSYLDNYDRALSTSKSVVGPRPMGTDQLDDWAHNVVTNLRGATRAANHGEMNDELLAKIANGERVSEDELHAIPQERWPINVKGRTIVPAPPASGIRTLANNGFQHVLNPMVNYISRQNIAFAEFERQYSRLLPLVQGGVMDDDEAMTVAMAKTSQIVIRNVHNLTDRTQWTVTLRNWAPFFFAQEQAYRRLGRLLAEDPAAFRKYQLMISNVHDVGQVLGGQNGQSYFVVPGTGWLTSSIPEAMNDLGLPVMGSTPVGMGWNLNSMSVIFPTSNGIRPDLGPVVAIPIQAIADFFPEAQAPALKADVNALASGVIGSAAMSSPIWEQLVPNTIIDRLMMAGIGDQGGTVLADRSFASTMMQTMAALDYQGKLPTGPTVNPLSLQTAADRIRNQTRIMYVLKALLGAITPVSPEVQVDYSNLKQTYDADAAAWDIATTPGSVAPGQTAAQALTAAGFSMNQLGFPPALNADIKREGSLTKGIQAYLEKNPDATAASVYTAAFPGATPFTVSQSSTPEGTYITASVQAEAWINDHASLITKYPMAAFYLMPQLTDTKYNAAIYNEQLAQGYRVKLQPATAQGVTGAIPSFLQQLYIAAGNAQFFGPNGAYTKYIAQTSGMTSAQKYPYEQQFYNVTLPAFQKQNPIWGQYWTSDAKGNPVLDPSGERGQAIAELQEMFRNGDAPPGKQTDEIRELLKDYQTYQNQIAWGSQDNFAVEKQSAIDQGWSDYLQAVAESHPELQAFIQGVFQSIAPQAGS